MFASTTSSCSRVLRCSCGDFVLVGINYKIPILHVAVHWLSPTLQCLQLMCSRTRVLCERDDEGPTAGAPELQKAIQNTLEHIFKKHEEVPYIGTYCKHVCGDLLCLQREETPVVTSEDEYM